MASYKRHNNFEDLEITRDEINQIGEALKKEEFRKLLSEYVDEVTDPENQKIYEKEITQLEKERGNDVTFIHPNPGYVVKTSVDGKKKAFINVCQNDKVQKPTAVREKGGINWSLPYTQAPPREDLDKKQNRCLVYDVVFHPDTIRMTKENHKFKHLVTDTALNAVEESFKVELDKKNLRFPKIEFKGLKRPTIIRKKSSNPPQQEDSDQGIFEIPNYPYPPVTENATRVSKMSKTPEKVPEYTEPKYTIKQRTNIDMQEYTNSMTSKINAAIPHELVVEIELPMIKSASDVTLDVTEKTLSLISEKPAKYKLDITLPYSVDENLGNAKFDNRIKKLSVTLIVRRVKSVSKCPELTREDSGVDSDPGSRSSPDSSSDEESKSPEQSEVYRTKDSDVLFLSPENHYTVPNHSCNILDNVVAFVLRVQNVEPDSAASKYFDNGFHLKFTSIGTGFFPIHYSFCCKFPDGIHIETENLSIEVWDNNVIVQLKLTACDISSVTEYYIGVDETSLEKFTFKEPVAVSKVIEKELNVKPERSQTEIEVLKCEESNIVLKIVNNPVEIEEKGDVIDSENVKEEVEPQEKGEEEKLDGKVVSDHHCDEKSLEDNEKDGVTIKRAEDKSLLNNSKSSLKSIGRALSESLPTKSDLKMQYRGILKVGRSLSESNMDEYHWYSSSVDNSESNSHGEKIKKTVRFSDCVSHQTYRANSSILGQRKKNQRKRKNKKRAQERRASESDVSESEMGNLKNGEDSLRTEEEASDISESCQSDISQSDVSESDDGLKHDKKDADEMSLSKCKPHKRGGKKSARKSAATAKMAFSNNLMFDLDM